MSDAAAGVLDSIPSPKLKPGGGFSSPIESPLTTLDVGNNLRAPITKSPTARSPQSAVSDLHASTGPVTVDMAIAAGFPATEAADYAALANFITKGEAHDFNQGYGSFTFNDYSAHPADKGWAGSVGPDGKQTHAAGLFQDQPDTWHKIALTYGLSDFSPTSQIKGNLKFAGDLYKKRTGRDLLTDFKAGNTEAISSILHDQWSSLGSGKSSIGPDSEFNAEKWIKDQSDVLQKYGDQASKLMEQALKESPGSQERHALMKEAIQHSRELSDEFRQMAKNPPKPKSPYETMSDWAPLAMGLMVFAGALTRRPALGAMNAAGAAITGLNEGNDQLYNRAMEVWKTQTSLAHQAFQMENDEIRNILEDQKLEETERQSKLRIAFEMLGLKKELDLARANSPKQLYDLLQSRFKFQGDLDEKYAKIEKELAEAARARAQAKLGGSTNPTLISWQQLREQWRTDNNYPPDQEIPPEVDNKLLRQAQTQSKGLTSKQIQENEQIESAQKSIGKLPPNFDKILGDYMAGKTPVPDRDQSGWSDLHKRLLEALHRPTFEKTAADVELIKQYELSKKPMLRPTGTQSDDNSSPGTEIDPARYQQALDVGYDREKVKAAYILDGGTAEEFEKRFAKKSSTAQPSRPLQPSGPAETYGSVPF